MFLSANPARLHAQGPPAREIVQSAVRAELAANNTDKSVWVYRDHDTVPGKNALYDTVETPQGSVRRLLELNGQPLSADARSRESSRISDYVNDDAAQAKARKAGEHDDAQATELLKMLPDAFVWTVRTDTAEAVTLDFKPNPDFQPPNMQSRVLSAMAGEMTVVHNGNRIRTLLGKLARDVKIGLGLLGKLNEGGTFQIERREVAPGRWQITETHVHIGGHALLFKTIGQQEDDVKTEWKPSPARTLQEAEEYLRDVR